MLSSGSLSVAVSPANMVSYSAILHTRRLPMGMSGTGHRLKNVSVDLRCFMVLAAVDSLLGWPTPICLPHGLLGKDTNQFIIKNQISHNIIITESEVRLLYKYHTITIIIHAYQTRTTIKRCQGSERPLPSSDARQQVRLLGV